MGSTQKDSCPYWIGQMCMKDFAVRIRNNAIDQCLAAIGEYDHDAYLDLKEVLEHFKNSEEVFKNEESKETEEDEKDDDEDSDSGISEKTENVEEEECEEDPDKEEILIDDSPDEGSLRYVSDFSILDENTNLAAEINKQIKNSGGLCQKGLSYSYDTEADVLYLWTDIGLWRVSEKDDLFVLHHKNHFSPEASFEEMIMGRYHKQVDQGATKSLTRLINYLVSHDKAKRIANGDYRKLPQTTKKQKMYYNRAKKRESKKAMRRTDYLFDQLESGNLEEFRITI